VIALVAFAASGLAAGTWLLWRVESPRTSACTLARAAKVSVIVPARNEASTLPVLLDSLQHLDPAPHEIIVVDDESDDATSIVAASHGTTVIRTSPPPGWLGKPWACHTGAAAATGDHLLFLDADTWLAPSSLDALVAEGTARGGLLSVQPYHVTVSPYEELSAYCNAVAMMGTGAFAARDRSRTATAFGPCLFTSAADYQRVGGHAAVRADVIEDLHLARRFHAEGLPTTCRAGGDLIRFRMYPRGLRQLVEGWSKNIAAGASSADPTSVIGAALWVGSHAAVAAHAGLGVHRWIRGTAGPPVTALVAWLAVSVHQQRLLRRIGSFRWSTAAAFPIPLAAFLAIFVRSTVHTWLRRQVTWRGRRIRLTASQSR